MHGGISELARLLICERDAFPKHNYMKMEIDVSLFILSDSSRPTSYDGGGAWWVAHLGPAVTYPLICHVFSSCS